MTEENKKEPIFTITREDGSTNEVFESDLDKKQFHWQTSLQVLTAQYKA